MSKKETKSLECLIEEFKESLNSITTELYTEKKRLVFIIDELDRCRPNFAVETIEKVKHLFSVPGIIWVLVMNKEQLEKSIHHVYGTIDAERYLNKFIDVQSSLPKDMKGNYNSLDHYRKLIVSLISISNCNILKHGYDALLVPFSQVSQLSIREIKKVLLCCELIFGGITDYVQEYTTLGIFMSVIKVADDQTYNSIKHKSTSINDLRKNGTIAKMFQDGLVKSMIWFLHFAMTPEEQRKAIPDVTAAKAMGLIESEPEFDEFQQFCRDKGRIIEGANLSLESICKKLDLFEIVSSRR